MSVDDEASPNRSAPQQATRHFGALSMVGFAALMLLAGVGLNAALDRVVSDRTWGTWGNIGQAFGAITAVAIVITFLLQYKELRLQRSSMDSQQREMKRTQEELHRSAEASIRMLHVDLLKMSIDDHELAEIWPKLPTEVPYSLARQFRYINLVIQHHRLAFEIGPYGEEEIRSALRYLLQSELVRAFWQATSSARLISLVPDTAEWQFAQIVNAVYEEEPDPPGPDLIAA